jgi:hypothetical protein
MTEEARQLDMTAPLITGAILPKNKNAGQFGRRGFLREARLHHHPARERMFKWA